ncbi:hypothetical protein LOZ80_09705 [Paenibacillus sp. HWE-109]|uniref:TerC family protein n=1 Tax=Paenibacillus sp. HWE-109 TaxID=1306526 RepID=UPI001EDEF6B4|nr:hypothetical protein [Paenibacillus sp. HWE-109]UKS29182.1 hypothetical protein LOZ80_09705 [Paenibacillus sp. HWE-109]
MQDWIIIFLYNIFTNIDNAIMVQGSLMKYSVRSNYKLYLIGLLCLLRVLYIISIQSFSRLPYINMMTGLIMLIFSIQMVLPKKSMRRHFSLLWIFSSVAFLDLIMSVDSILLTAKLSDNVGFVAIAVVPALCLLFFFFSKMELLLIKMPWIEAVVAGLLAQLAVLQIKKEPGILQWLQDDGFDLMSIIALCIICSVGWYNQFKKNF